MEKSKVWFWILLDIVIGASVIVLLFGLLPYLGSLSGSYMPARTINVNAQGKTTATPDLAVLTFSVVTQGKTPDTLSNNNNDKMNSVLQFVSSQGIASSDIKTVSYDLEPNYGYTPIAVPQAATISPSGANVAVGSLPAIIYPPTRPQTIVGYTLTQTVQVKIHDLTKVASVLGGLAPLGVNQIGGVNFTFNDQNAVTALARADAIQKAQEKAQMMASAAGARLGGIVNMNESYYFPSPEVAYGMGGGVGMKSLAASTPTIAPGTQDITDNVSITYELK